MLYEGLVAPREDPYGKAPQRGCGVSFYGEDPSGRPSVQPTYCRLPALAGSWTWSFEAPSNPCDSVIPRHVSTLCLLIFELRIHTYWASHRCVLHLTAASLGAVMRSPASSIWKHIPAHWVTEDSAHAPLTNLPSCHQACIINVISHGKCISSTCWH